MSLKEFLLWIAAIIMFAVANEFCVVMLYFMREKHQESMERMERKHKERLARIEAGDE